MKWFFAKWVNITIILGIALLNFAFAENIESQSWTDENGNMVYMETNNSTGKITEKTVDKNGNVIYIDEYDKIDGSDDSSESPAGTTKNADGSITVVSRDQTGADYSNVDTSNSSSGSSDGSSSGGLTQEEWEARMAKAISANGSVTETVYRDANGNIWPVQVEYMGLGRSAVIVNGERCLVPTSSLTWVTEAPENKLLAVVTTEKQSYVTLRAKKSQKSFVMDHCEKCQVLRVISTGKTWTMVDCNGMRGYVLTSGLTFYDNSPKDFVTGVVTFRGKTTSKNLVHIRSGITGSARQLQEFACGTPLTIFMKDGKWCEVDVGGWHAYIKSEYVTMDDGAVLAAADPEYTE